MFSMMDNLKGGVGNLLQITAQIHLVIQCIIEVLLPYIITQLKSRNKHINTIWLLNKNYNTRWHSG
jgi:hypothetical protein